MRKTMSLATNRATSSEEHLDATTATQEVEAGDHEATPSEEKEKKSRTPKVFAAQPRHSHSKANLLIEQAQQDPSFRKRKLTKFIYFPHFVSLTLILLVLKLIVLAVVSLILAVDSRFTVVNVVCIVLSITVILACTALLVVYGQHLYVVFFTLPAVMKLTMTKNTYFTNPLFAHKDIEPNKDMHKCLKEHPTANGAWNGESSMLQDPMLISRAIEAANIARNTSVIVFISTLPLLLWSLITLLISVTNLIVNHDW